MTLSIANRLAGANQARSNVILSFGVRRVTSQFTIPQSIDKRVSTRQNIFDLGRDFVHHLKSHKYSVSFLFGLSIDAGEKCMTKLLL